MNENVDYLQRFSDLYDALNAERKWFNDAGPLRFAAITAASCPGPLDGVATDIRAVAAEIKKLSGTFGIFGDAPRVQFLVAAVVVMSDDDASEYLDEVERVQGLFRNCGLRRGGIFEAVAILIMRLQNHLQPIPTESVERFQDIYEEMKRYNWILTGPKDFPACATLVGEKESPSQMGKQTEEIYQSLVSACFNARRDSFQTAAHLLLLSPAAPADAVARWLRLASEFRSHGVSIWHTDYDELAMLSFLDCPVEEIADHVLRNRESMKQLRPRIDKVLTFSLASIISFLELAHTEKSGDSKHLINVQRIVGLQQAVAATAIDAHG